MTTTGTHDPRVCVGVPAGGGRTLTLAPGVRYHGTIDDLAFGHVPRSRLIRTLSSGRLCSILLEDEIAAVFGVDSGTQGAGADLIDPQLGTIQMKTHHAVGDARYQRGPDAGTRKAARPNIWTTKSGFWDRRDRLTPEQLAEAEAYIDAYDHFGYVDISQMTELRYSFVLVPATVVKAVKCGFYISEDAINATVTRTEHLPG